MMVDQTQNMICVADKHPDLFIGRCLYDANILKGYNLDLEHLAQLRDINLQWVAHNQRGLARLGGNLVDAHVYGWAGYEFIREACNTYLGSDWKDYFYPEFVSALTPNTPAFSFMVECLHKARYSSGNMGLAGMSEPTYGYFVNQAAYHPNMQKLTTYLVFAATEELYPAGRKEDSLPACYLLDRAIEGKLDPKTPTMLEMSIEYIDSLHDGRKGQPSYFYGFVELAIAEFKKMAKP
jgi:hypothetical protein